MIVLFCLFFFDIYLKDLCKIVACFILYSISSIDSRFIAKINKSKQKKKNYAKK